MSTNPRRLGPRSEPNTRPSMAPRTSFQRYPSEAALLELKKRLLAEVLENTFLPYADRRIGLAADEAAALAWTTPYPGLFFPALFQEKVREAEAYADRQAEVHRFTRELLAL